MADKDLHLSMEISDNLFYQFTFPDLTMENNVNFLKYDQNFILVYMKPNSDLLLLLFYDQLVSGCGFEIHIWFWSNQTKSTHKDNDFEYHSV